MTSPLLVNLEDAAASLQVGKTTLFRLLKEGQLRGVKIGKRRFIPRAELEAYVDGLLAVTEADWQAAQAGAASAA